MLTLAVTCGLTAGVVAALATPWTPTASDPQAAAVMHQIPTRDTRRFRIMLPPQEPVRARDSTARPLRAQGGLSATERNDEFTLTGRTALVRRLAPTASDAPI